MRVVVARRMKKSSTQWHDKYIAEVSSRQTWEELVEKNKKLEVQIQEALSRAVASDTNAKNSREYTLIAQVEQAKAEAQLAKTLRYMKTLEATHPKDSLTQALERSREQLGIEETKLSIFNGTSSKPGTSEGRGEGGGLDGREGEGGEIVGNKSNPVDQLISMSPTRAQRGLVHRFNDLDRVPWGTYMFKPYPKEEGEVKARYLGHDESNSRAEVPMLSAENILPLVNECYARKIISDIGKIFILFLCSFIFFLWTS